MDPLKSSLDNSFPGNSNRQREEGKTPPPKPQLTGQTSIKKENPFLIFYRAVFSGTIQDVKKSLFDRMVNVTKTVIYDTVLGFLDDYINGGSPFVTSNTQTRSSLTNPERYWNSPRQPLVVEKIGGYSYRTVTYNNKDDANAVLKSMIAWIDEYPSVPVSMYLDYSGYGSSVDPIDNDWGWKSLAGVDVKPAPMGRRGYILTLPRPESLK